MTHCPDCGAPLDLGRQCRDYFYELLALEARVPGVPDLLSHFYAVATYNLQHPAAFIPGAIYGLRTALTDALGGNADIRELRRRAGAAAQGITRVLRQPAEDGESSQATLTKEWPTEWPMTVRDVCIAEPQDYERRVREWATSVAAVLPD